MTIQHSQGAEEYLLPADAARVIGVSVRTLKRYVAAGLIAPDRRLPSGHTRFAESTVRRFVAEGRGAA